MTRSSLILASLLVVACKSEKKDPPAEATKPVAEPEKPGARAEAIANAPTPLAPGMTRLDALGLQIKLPPNTQVHPSHGSTYDLILPGSVFLGVKEEDELAPKTLDEAKRFVSVYTPIGLKSEELPDGWVLTFKTEANGPPPAAWMITRRKIGDKTYECRTTGGSPEDIKAVIAACKSLKR